MRHGVCGELRVRSSPQGRTHARTHARTVPLLCPRCTMPFQGLARITLQSPMRVATVQGEARAGEQRAVCDPACWSRVRGLCGALSLAQTPVLTSR